MVCVFENARNNPAKNDLYISRAMTVVYSRFQNEEELKDAWHQNRMFTKYGYFIDEKPFNGDIEKALHQNFEADSNNVTLEERILIREKLRESYYKLFNRKPLRQLQLEL